jgi:hypothetical protein
VSQGLVYVTEDAVAGVRARAAEAAPFEIGGIIVGAITDDGVWITDFVAIPGQMRHHARFLIPAGATYRIIDATREADPRLGYLGDWHTHPAHAGPSRVDFATLRDLAVGPFGPRRLLAVVMRSDPAWNIGLWALGRLRAPLRVAHELTGPLPLGVESAESVERSRATARESG